MAPTMPPYATDEPDTFYESAPAPTRRLRQPTPADPNKHSSAYDMYDSYLDGAPRPSTDSRDDKNAPPSEPRERVPQPPAGPIPLAAPRPGYAAPIAALNLARPAPAAVSPGRQQLFTSPSPIGVPSTPHPLQAPLTPITPVFARPAQPAVAFATPRKPIMRGNSEETLLPKRGEKGDDFWRRFSMVAKEENKKPWEQKQSPWLRKTQNGTSRLARWVWIVGICLLLCIGAAAGLGWYASHKNTAPSTAPTAFGGSANEVATPDPSTTSAVHKSSTSLHVSPTNTVARRFAPVPSGLTHYLLPPRDPRRHARLANRTHA